MEKVRKGAPPPLGLNCGTGPRARRPARGALRPSPEGLPGEGVYALVLRVGRGFALRHGRLGRLAFRPGFYAYVGRAKRALPARIARHCRGKAERAFWHVDHLLLQGATPVEVWVYPLEVGECALASELEKRGGERATFRGFGSSDCRCPGHLLRFGPLKPRPAPGAMVLPL